jgi:hypothetical protein
MEVSGWTDVRDVASTVKYFEVTLDAAPPYDPTLAEVDSPPTVSGGETGAPSAGDR